MNDTACDNTKRIHRVLWYVACVPGLYILSFPIAVQIIFYLHLRYDLTGSTVTRLVWMFYSPAWKLFEAIGVLAPMFHALDRVAKWLP